MSLSDGLGRADVMTRIYALACHYGSEQRLLYAVQTSEGLQGGVGDLRGLFQELSIRLKDTFQLTKEQKVWIKVTTAGFLLMISVHQLTIRWLAQDFIYKSSRTAFKVLYLDIEVCSSSGLSPEWYRLRLNNRKSYVPSLSCTAWTISLDNWLASQS